MPIPSPADFRDKTKKHSQVREMLAQVVENVAFKPVLNSDIKDLNNLDYGINIYNVGADITLANNFPVAGSTTSVMTYRAAPSNAKYQTAVCLLTTGVRIFNRSYLGTWSSWSESATKTAVDEIVQAYNSNASANPTFNRTEKNLNNLNHGVDYYNQVADITLENNFPVASSPAMICTYKSAGSSVKYQRAVYPFSNPVRIFDRSFTNAWSSWVETVSRAQVDANTNAIATNAIEISKLESKTFSVVGKNLFDKSKLIDGEYISPGSSKITSSANYKRSGFIPVEEGINYYLSGNQSSALNIGWFAVADKTATAISVTSTRSAIAPVGAKFAVFNITGDGTATYNNTTQFEIGSVATVYEAYNVKIKKSEIQDSDNFVLKNEILDSYSFNKIDPSKINFTRRYSTANKGFVTDANLIAHTDLIPVTEGEWYAFSGTGAYGTTASGMQGGYFTSNASNAVDNITFVAPVSGGGGCFKVPTGQGITHIVLNVKKTTGNILDGVVQLELGEMATAYQAYSIKQIIKPQLIQGSGNGASAEFDNATWYKYVNADGGKIFQDKLPKFRKAMLLKNEDVVVVNTGTSLTARTSEHCTLRTDAAFRPPMMHTNAFCSHIWDALKWEGQQYRRYDAAYFTETGTFVTSSNLAEWDDGAARDGLTRYSESVNASVQFKVPIDVWQFNFIYRTDSVGCEAKVTVAEGTGNIQVFDEPSQAWVEANNYIFSMVEQAPVARTVNIPNPVTAALTAVTLASKGNTTYQKRLKMRCRDNAVLNSLASVKNVTIANTGAGRLMYWGVEWSPRQFMITYINAARGSHNTSATGASGLPRFQDNEIWSFKPDLILSELGIHNDGAAAAGSYPVGQWAGLTHNYITNNDYELSMFSRASHFGLNPEYAFFTASIAWNFGGINEDGSLKYSLQTASVKGPVKAMSALDKYQEAIQFLRENHPDIVAIDAAKRWVEACIAIYGDMKTATQHIQGINNKSGPYLTNDSSHWNDLGAQIMAKAVIPLLG
ncbi:pyocin knob domain-containing protein [Acinetobacter schindleri]|uniref:pyocin knob domain-containing protein n=1 Tax=Acinetobacter schindleri TaxID=108981 RepID=UPI003CFDF0ED